jgi:hypothetical protein
MPASAVAGEAGSERPGEHRAPQVAGELMIKSHGHVDRLAVLPVER